MLFFFYLCVWLSVFVVVAQFAGIIAMILVAAGVIGLAIRLMRGKKAA